MADPAKTEATGAARAPAALLAAVLEEEPEEELVVDELVAPLQVFWPWMTPPLPPPSCPAPLPRNIAQVAVMLADEVRLEAAATCFRTGTETLKEGLDGYSEWST